MHHEWPAHDVDWFDPSIVIWSCLQRLLFWRGISRASPFAWLHLASFRFIWFGVSWFCARGQAMSRGARRFSSDNHCVEPRFRSVSLRRRWCRMMQNEHEWTKQSRSNLRVQLVEADLNSTNLFGNSDDDNLLAGEPFPLRYWHYDWHECECHSAVRQRESEEICTVGKRTKVLSFRIRNW